MTDYPYKRINEIPFDSTRKLMSIILKLDNGKYRIITKGAPEVLINKCTFYEEDGVKKAFNTNYLDKTK